ncbi:MAG: 4-hydroxy-3-methylbut-2-enyl diphosphate reductase [Candidatus Eisenbacteria bacterium]
MPISRKAKRKNLHIIISEGVGFCSGVKRAIKVALAAARQAGDGVCSLGPLIHNPQVVEKLEEVGIKPLRRLRKGGGLMVVRSHGASREILEKAESYGYEIIDATCPFVRKAQENARKLLDRGYRVVIVGEKDHPEVKTIRSHVDNKAVVVETFEQAKRLKFGSRVGIIAQTTMSVDMFADVVGHIARRAKEVLVFNTICIETVRRQERASSLAHKVDVLLVVGGRNSANTSRLKSLCSSICAKTHHVETASEIDGRWFKRGATVGIVAGASTPKWLVENIFDRLKQM